MTPPGTRQSAERPGPRTPKEQWRGGGRSGPRSRGPRAPEDRSEGLQIGDTLLRLNAGVKIFALHIVDVDHNDRLASPMTSAVEPRERVYAAVRLLTRFWIGFLFRDASVRNVERVPLRGPVLLCINHPNNLIDSLLVSVVLSRPVHYLASASIFRGAFLARFLARAGVIPVYRHQDDAGRADRPGQPGPADRNAEMFAACHQALRAGQVIAMYPEGTTHSEERIQRIKTGAARI